MIFREELCSDKFLAKIRTILSWNSPPPAGAPGWIPVWGNVVESDLQIEDSQVDIPGALHSTLKHESPKSCLDAMERITETSGGTSIGQGRLQSTTVHSTKTDSQHDFLAFVLAKAATFDLSIANLRSRKLEPVDCEATEFRFPFAITAKPANLMIYEHGTR
jgi:hypothetical protein